MIRKIGGRGYGKMYFLTQYAKICPRCKTELRTENNKKICDSCNMKYDIALICERGKNK